MNPHTPADSVATDGPGPYALSVGMIVAVAVHVVVVGASVGSMQVLGGLGAVACLAAAFTAKHRTVVTWPVAVALAVALPAESAVLGVTLIVVAAGLVGAVTGRVLRFFAATILTDLPPAMLVVAILAWSPQAPGPASALLAGCAAGFVAGRWGTRVASWVIPNRRTPAVSTRVWWEAVAVGALGGMLGVVAAEGGLWLILLAAAGLVLAVGAEFLDRRRGAAESTTVAALIVALESRDLYTGGHAVRVAESAALIANEMRLDTVTTRRVVVAALLHDIGKIATPLRLLRKPGRLTADEYAIVQQHAQAAEAVLHGIDVLSPVSDIVSGHHRHVDGDGYGTDTAPTPSIEARIVAVADAFDAMTSNRPYRTALSHAWAAEELRAHVGTQFDGAVVEALLRAIPTVAEPSAAESDGEARRHAEAMAGR